MIRQPRPSLDLLKQKSDLVGIEIGVHKGINARWMLENLDIKKLYLIDPYEEYRCNNNKPLDDGGMHPASPIAKKECKENLESWENKIEYIYKFSWDVLDDIGDKSVDFVYLDGDHRVEALLLDLEYIRKIKFGGLLCGHDWSFSSVKKAVEQFLSNKRYVFNCCKTNQYIDIITKHVKGNDWWIMVPEPVIDFNHKCRLCQKIFHIKTEDVQWLM